MAALQVLYVPSAKALIEGGSFHQHESGGWDNPTNARLVLMGLMHHHAAQLSSMAAPSQAASKAAAGSAGKPAAATDDSTSGPSTLKDVMQAAMDPLAEDLPVQAVLDIVEVLLKQEEVSLLLKGR